MKDYIIVISIFVPLILVYVLTYFLNSKTDAPENVESIEKCNVCTSNSCAVRGLKEALDEAQCEITSEQSE